MSTQHFLCLQRNKPQPKGEKKLPPSPAEMESMYASFTAWREKYQTNIVDLGGKLGASKLVTEEAVMDGPFVETKEIIGGYMIVSAESWEEAIAIARESPAVSARSNIEVHEIKTE